MLEVRPSSLEPNSREAIAREAFDAGRRSSLAVAALALSLVSFISLLGAEKAILAIVLGTVAIRGSAPGAPSRRLGLAAIGIGAIFIATIVIVLTVYWDKAVEFIEMLKQLS